jgi:hypothetical protein
MERNRFISSDGNCFEHVGEAAYASPLAAEAHATQIEGIVGRRHLVRWLDFGGGYPRQSNRAGADRRRKNADEIGSRSAALAASDQKIAVLWRKRHKTGSAATAPGFPRIHTR